MRPQLGKQKLLDAAALLFESHGYFSTTVEQITVEAGVSKGLVYNYFSSKEDLLVGLIDSATSQMESVTPTIESNESIERSLKRFIDSYLHFLKTEKRFLKLQLTLMLTPELREVVAEPLRRRAALLLKIVSGLLRSAGVEQPMTKSRLFLAMLDGVALHYLCVYERYPLSTLKMSLSQTAINICKDQ